MTNGHVLPAPGQPLPGGNGHALPGELELVIDGCPGRRLAGQKASLPRGSGDGQHLIRAHRAGPRAG